jgi:hypothetical protein
VTDPNTAPRLLVRTWPSSVAVAGALAEHGVTRLTVCGRGTLTEHVLGPGPEGPRTVAARSTDLPALLMSVPERTELATDDRTIVIQIEGGTFRIHAGAAFRASVDAALRQAP